MAIKGKERFTVYLDEDNVQFIKSFLDTRRGQGGFSSVLDFYLDKLVSTIRLSGTFPVPNSMSASLLFAHYIDHYGVDSRV